MLFLMSKISWYSLSGMLLLVLFLFLQECDNIKKNYLIYFAKNFMAHTDAQSYQTFCANL